MSDNVGKPKGLPGYSEERAEGVKKGYKERDFLQKLILSIFGSDEEEKLEEEDKEEVKETPTPSPTPEDDSSKEVSEGLKKLIKMKRGNK